MNDPDHTPEAPVADPAAEILTPEGHPVGEPTNEELTAEPVAEVESPADVTAAADDTTEPCAAAEIDAAEDDVVGDVADEPTDEELTGEPAAAADTPVVVETPVAEAAPVVAEPEPETVNGFAELGLRPELLRCLSDLGYEEPTPIQREAIPHLIAGQ